VFATGVFRDLTIIENRNQLPTPLNKNLGYRWAIWNIPGNTHALPASLPSVQFPLQNSAEQPSGGPRNRQSQEQDSPVRRVSPRMRSK
jgi:hypothetical protein